MNNRARRVAMAILISFSAGIDAGEAMLAVRAPVVDGSPDDQAWQLADWVELQYSILETAPTSDDFSGRYKVVWTADYLYLLAEISDDILIDATPDPLESYWDDDTLEIFVDENGSGGDHLNNDNAYAYHVALDNQVVDRGPDGKPKTYPSHVTARWARGAGHRNAVYWEAQIALVAEGSETPRKLSEGQALGFMVAYCDADDSNGRKHFFGDVEIEPVAGDRNRGYLDASVFGKLILVKEE